MNDKQKVKVLLKPIVNACYVGFRDLDMLLGKNQNRPPMGEADGSFEEEKEWLALRDIVRAIDEIQRAAKILGVVKPTSATTFDGHPRLVSHSHETVLAQALGQIRQVEDNTDK